MKLAETGHNELRDVPVLRHFVEPRKGPAGQLHTLESEQGAAGFALQPGRVEQLHQAGQAGGFALGVAHPRRLLQQQVFQLLILGQLAFEGVFLGGGAVLRLPRPLGQNGFEARVGLENLRCQ